jgi:hypothetical protein
MVSAALGYEFTSDALRRSDCPYVVRGRIALYSDDDLRALVERELAQSKIRGGVAAA